MIGHVIKESRELKGITQQDLARKSYLSDKTISAIETGRRPVTKENLKTICRELDDPMLYMEAVNEVCGDVFTVHWLNGKAADLHRASVKSKVVEELGEALKAINLTKVCNKPQTCNAEDLKSVVTSIQETIDVYKAAAIYIAVMCREYNVDIKDMFRIQKEKLILRQYLEE